MMKTKWIKWMGVVILISAGYFTWSKYKAKGGPNQTESRIVTAELGDIEETVESTGEVAPLNRVEVKPPIQGRIEKLLVDEGDKVKAGQILAWMSSSDRAAILDAARAKGPQELKKWEDTYKPTPLIAPLSGVVILRNTVVGQTVSTADILFALSDKLIVLARVDEVDIGRITVGMRTRITLDSYPDQSISGHVASILYEGKNVSNVITYGVKIEPDTVPPFFRSQMTSNVSLIIAQKKNTLLIPIAALNESRSGEKQVFLPTEKKGKPKSQPVEVGLRGSDKVEILAGLQAGDQIVIMSKRYSPQKASASSPLVMGGSGGQRR